MNCPVCNSAITIEKTEFFETRICEFCLDFCEIIDLSQCCINPNFETRKLIISNGGIQVRNQCTNCGFVDGKSLGGFASPQRESLTEVDVSFRVSRDNKISTGRKSIFERIRCLKYDKFQQKHKEDVESYRNVYLQSPEWKLKRKLVLERDNYICQACRVNGATDVHHITYGMIGNEPLFNLISVCRNCHNAITEMQKIGETNIKIHQ